MHELSIALSIIDGASEELRRHENARAVALHLRIGPLSGVVKDALQFAFELARADTPLETAELKIEDVPLVVFCPQCDGEKRIETYEGLCCPVCGTLTPEVRSGRELELKAIELAEESELAAAAN